LAGNRVGVCCACARVSAVLAHFRKLTEQLEKIPDFGNNVKWIEKMGEDIGKSQTSSNLCVFGGMKVDVLVFVCLRVPLRVEFSNLFSGLGPCCRCKLPSCYWSSDGALIVVP